MARILEPKACTRIENRGSVRLLLLSLIDVPDQQNKLKAVHLHERGKKGQVRLPTAQCNIARVETDKCKVSF